MKRMLLGAAVLLAMAGCNRVDVDKEHYEKVRVGMTAGQVEEILGKGNAASQADAGGVDTRQLVWKSGEKQITVSFSNGKVVNKVKAGF
ncbi:MAG: DUF3862 domain-containing protein [Tepidisphaerales bacterium]